jgi:hypothetical protein
MGFELTSLPASFERKEIQCRSSALSLNHVSDRPLSTRCFSMRRVSRGFQQVSETIRPHHPRVLDLVVDVTLLVPETPKFSPNRTGPLSSSSSRPQQAEAT